VNRLLGAAWNALADYSLQQAEQLVPVVGELRQVLQPSQS
jgi:hypothetical protein